MKRAADRVIAARPYAKAMAEVIANLYSPDLADRFPLLRQPAATKQLLTLLQIGRDFRRVDSLDAYLESVLWKVAEALDAQHGAVFLADAANEAPTLRAQLTSGRNVIFLWRRNSKMYSIEFSQ